MPLITHNIRRRNWLATLGAFALFLLLVAVLRSSRSVTPIDPPIRSTAGTDPAARATDHSALSANDRPPVRLPPVPPARPAQEAAPVKSLIEMIEERGKLPPEVFGQWLDKGRTNAADLLAIRQVGGGEQYLRMALTNFPNDPRVLMAAVALNDGPDAQRERLDRFKKTAPDNALADYLSARDHLKKGNTEQAVADLLSASAKTRFEDYTAEAMQTAEELYLDAGRSPAEAKLLGSSSTYLPHLAQLKGLAQDMAALERQYLAAGDTASAQNLAQMGMQLGEQLSTGAGSRCLINQLVGVAVEKIVLTPLDGGTPYPFLNATVPEHLAQIDAFRDSVKQDAHLAEAWFNRATEAELMVYFDRLKLFGETDALTWLKQRQNAGH
jgi:hypothetical protein